MKNFLLTWIFTIIFTASLVFPLSFTIADSDLDVDWFEIMPKLTWGQIDKVNESIDKISGEAWNVWKNYNTEAKKLKTSEQIASWIMTRDTIMNYIVFVVKFLGQVWLVVWAWFIIYAWYKYMLSVFGWWKTASSTLKNAIIWVIIVIFSYAIMKIFTSIIWLT